MRHTWLFVIYLLSQLSFADVGDTLFVLSEKVFIHKEANLKSEKVVTLSRGDTVKVVEEKETWTLVEAKDKSGWVPKLFLTPNKPIGKAEMSAELPGNAKRASRKRASSYSVTTATRGLSGETNNGSKQEVDFESVEQMEAEKVSPEEIEKFRANGKLSKP